MKKLLRPLGLLSLALSLCFLSGCVTVSVNTPDITPSAAVTNSPPPTAEVSRNYYAVSVNGRQGVVDDSGQVVLPFEYSDINVLYQDETPAAIYAIPAVVKTGREESSYTGKLYSLDGNTVYVDNCIYAYTISDSLITFMNTANKYGIIAFDGKEVVPAEYDYILMCGENNIAAVKGDMYSVLNKSVDVEIYDKNGKLQTSGKLNFVNAYNDLILVTDDTGTKYGLVDLSLTEKIPPVWDELTIVSDGLCVARSGNRYGVIDVSGNEVIPFKYNYIDIRYDPKDLKPVSFMAQADEGAYLFDQNGKQVFFSDKFRYIYIENGMMIAQDQSDVTHYINAEGEDIVPPAEWMYTDISGYIYCTKDQLCTCYTREGEKLPLPESQSIYTLSPERFIYVTKDNWLYGLCGKDGSIIVPAEYSYLYPYNEESELLIFFKTDKSGKTSAGLIDPDDGSIVMGGFDMLQSFRGGLFYVKKGPTSGLIDINGSWIWRTSDYATLMD